MAFLALFSKRDKSKAQDAASANSDQDPTEPDYVLPSLSTVPSLYSVPSASSSKLKIGFKSKKPLLSTRTDSNLLAPPSAASFQSFRSGSENNLNPPPSKSALFSGYGDPTGAHSTRSLPTNPTAHSRSGSKEYVDPPLPPPKNSKGGLFSWAHRERKKSKAPPPPSQLKVNVASTPNVNLDSDSFNLRAFRHVRPVSPNEPPPAILPPVRPRPRENSFASDSSQRISVAAFREAQARRSAANSPTPSSTNIRSPASANGLRPPSSFAMRNSRSISGDSDTDDSDGADSEADSTLRPRRNRSTKPRATPGKKSVSELGHKTVMTTPPQPPRMPTSATTTTSFSLNGEPKVRPRASASTSALQPSAAARQASFLTAQQAELQRRQQAQPQGKFVTPPAKVAHSTYHASSSSSSSSSSESNDSDDAPLATLVGPKRPGSAASSARTASRLPQKPLIDINGLTPRTPSSVFGDTDCPPLPAKDLPQSSPQVVPKAGHASKPSLNDRLTRLAKSAAKSTDNVDQTRDTEEPARKVPLRSETMPVESLSLPPKPSDDEPLSPPRKVNGRSMSSPNAILEPHSESSSTPIVPISIRTRTPPPTFAVTSRPPSQLSIDPDSRASEETVRIGRQRASTLVSQGDILSSPGFTGGGLLAGAHGTPTPSSRGRQRSSTMITTPSMSSSQSSLAADSPSRPAIRTSPVASSSSKDLVPPRFSTRSNSPASTSERSTTASGSTAPPSALRSSFKPKSALKGSSNPSSPVDTRPRQATFPSVDAPPRKPFAGASYTVALRGNSPASSTGDSSSGRTPITPVDGSEIGSASTKRGHRKSSSVTFDDSSRGRPRSREGRKGEVSDGDESRRRERRRSEARAAIELGKIVNGRGPILTNEDDGPQENMASHISMFNPMMGAGMNPMMHGHSAPTPSTMPWSPQASPNAMMNPMFPMIPASSDPMMMAAHQQAMMVAKQAFQMAFAQQALAAANDEWERGSTATSAYGGFSNMGGMSSMGGMPMGGGLMPGMGMPPMPWGMQMFPSTPSMYGGSVIGGSEIGVPTPGRGAGWASRTAYGEQGGYTGSAAERASAVYRSSQYLGLGGSGGISSARSDIGGPTSRGQQRPRTKTNPSDVPLPSPAKRGGPPPSSWSTRGSRPA